MQKAVESLPKLLRSLPTIRHRGADQRYRESPRCRPASTLWAQSVEVRRSAIKRGRRDGLQRLTFQTIQKSILPTWHTFLAKSGHDIELTHFAPKVWKHREGPDQRHPGAGIELRAPRCTLVILSEPHFDAKAVGVASEAVRPFADNLASRC